MAITAQLVVRIQPFVPVVVTVNQVSRKLLLALQELSTTKQEQRMYLSVNCVSRVIIAHWDRLYPSYVQLEPTNYMQGEALLRIA